MDKAIETATTTLSSVVETATKQINDALPQSAKDTLVQAHSTVTAHGTAAVEYATATYNTHKLTVEQAAAQAKEFALATSNTAKENLMWTYNTTTATVTAYTEKSPIKAIINDTVANAQAVRADPVATLKPYVPAFVVHTTERSYEIYEKDENVQHFKDQVTATTGYVISKVNGSVEYIQSIPEVNSVLAKLKEITAPVFGDKKEVSAAEAELEVNGGAEVAPSAELAALSVEEKK
ncbi:hypothetical protein HDU78_007095 [Chytriomyces hyalinus]|nr:hypothetical protein HDU78_007095 [Chytriomyces hyalinus]KAJ3264448.1 hypothetical protein HDU77_008463 [Chytriomyces hyalinus]